MPGPSLLPGVRTVARLAVAAVSLNVFLPQPALPQSVEVSATVGVGMHGSQSEARSMLGGQVGVWWNHGWQTTLRATWFAPSDFSGVSTYYIGSADDPRPVGLRHTPGKRRVVTSQTLYHFRRGTMIRPFLGPVFGVIRDREVNSCDIAGCEALAPALPFGPRSSSTFSLGGAFGASADISEHFVIRGGVQLHCPMCEEFSIVETFVDIGYRFGKR
jgi:hypothetical protein